MEAIHGGNSWRQFMEAIQKPKAIKKAGGKSKSKR
jgi:hypothetical protein